MESVIPDVVMIGWINGRSGGRSNALAGDLAWKADTTKGLHPGTSHSALTVDASNSRNEKCCRGIRARAISSAAHKETTIPPSSNPTVQHHPLQTPLEQVEVGGCSRNWHSFLL